MISSEFLHFCLCWSVKEPLFSYMLRYVSKSACDSGSIEVGGCSERKSKSVRSKMRKASVQTWARGEDWEHIVCTSGLEW